MSEPIPDEYQQKLLDLINSDEYRAKLNRLTPIFTFAKGGICEEAPADERKDQQ